MNTQNESGSLIVCNPKVTSKSNDIMNGSLNFSENESLYKQEVLEEGIKLKNDDINLSFFKKD